MSSFSFLLVACRLKAVDKHVGTIKSTQDMIEATPLEDKASPYGIIITSGEMFMQLAELRRIALATVLGATFPTVWVLLCSAFSAVKITVCSARVVLSCLLTLGLLISSHLITVVGMSVKFTARLVALHAHQVGAAKQRLTETLQVDWLPAILSTLVTFGGEGPRAKDVNAQSHSTKALVADSGQAHMTLTTEHKGKTRTDLKQASRETPCDQPSKHTHRLGPFHPIGYGFLTGNHHPFGRIRFYHALRSPRPKDIEYVKTNFRKVSALTYHIGHGIQTGIPPG